MYKQPSCKSTRMERLIPRFTASDHCVENGQQLAHASHESDLLGFAHGKQSLGEGFDDRVVARGHPATQCRTHLLIAAPCRHEFVSCSPPSRHEPAKKTQGRCLEPGLPRQYPSSAGNLMLRP